jgi:hypothetical protein
MENNMNFQELKRLVKTEFRKTLNESSFRHELPPEEHAAYDRIRDRRHERAVEELKSYALENFENWAHEEVEDEIAEMFVEDYIHTDQVGFEDAHYILDLVVDEIQESFLEHYEGEEADELSLDKIFEKVTFYMEDSDY